MKITVVGLGLIGGSVLRRLRGFKNSTLCGFDINAETLRLAGADGVLDVATDDPKEALKDADFVILCLYPQLNVDFVRENREYIKQGAVITDVSGIKGYVISEIRKYLPQGCDFVGGHPMAGREVGGYQSSTDTLFDNASYLITPTKENLPENIQLVRDMATYIGCRHIVTTTPEEHDEIIAYTSQLMHVVAVALCDNPMLERSTYFSAGSLRDCTRVAIINAKMWSELFVENKDALCDRIDEMIDSLAKIKNAVRNSDRDELEKIMRHATEQKLKWLMD